MKICAISDLHGDLIDISPCNLLIICGDIIPLNKQTSGHKSLAWLRNKFIPWVTNLPCDKVIFIAGNHDWVAEKSSGHLFEMFPKYSKITYLFHEDYEYEGLKIFGTPYCQRFYNWAFMRDDEDLQQMYKCIPKDLDILITHDAPYGVSDVLLQSGYTKEHIGNKPLREAILEKEPKYVLHGHLHSTSHEFELLGSSKVVNCSIKDEQYQLVYDPIYFEI